MASDQDRVMAEIYRKIDRERALIHAASNMQKATNNAAVQARVDTQIREGRKNIDYLEERLRTLQLQMQPSPPPPPQHGGQGQYGSGQYSQGQYSQGQYSQGQYNHGHGQSLSGNSGTSPPMPPPKDPNGRSYGGRDQAEYGGPGSPEYRQSSPGTLQSVAPFADPRPFQPVPKARPNFSKLDLIKYDTQYLGPKIQLMLSQLEFKLSVEKQYKAGIEKMVRLYQDEGDRKSRADAEGKRIESNQKVQLLQQALKRYADLHVGIGEDEAGDDDSLNAPNMRKPLTGHLQIRIHAVRDMDHAVLSRFSRGPESFVVIKVEDNVRAKTRGTRTDKWTEESFNVDIDKANEIELTVYDKAGDRPSPIGFLWIRISDIAEEMRRKKIESEFQQNGWVSADKMADGGSPGKSGGQFPPQRAPHTSSGDTGSVNPDAAAPGAQQSQNAAMIDSWFSLEPAGRIHLTISFQKQMGARRPYDIGLNRQGAVRQKKEEVHEKQGHKFVKQQFYNVMRCALCGEFLKYAAGMQCADCKYTCHQKCYPKVVTKCISKANYETDPDEEKINHRIPHRFEGFSNIGANWCCHCGYLLPIGRKNAKKCSECGSTCHQQCAHLVPDFCGMSMIVANEILETIQRTKQHNKTSSISSTSGLSGRTLRPESKRPGISSSATTMTGIPYDAGAGHSPRPNYDAGGFDQQVRPPSMDARSAAAKSYQQPASPGRPEPPRTVSANDAVLAASAAAGRPGSVQNHGKQSSAYERQSGAQAAPIPSYDPSVYDNFNKSPPPRQQPMPQQYAPRTDPPRQHQQPQQQQYQQPQQHQQYQQHQQHQQYQQQQQRPTSQAQLPPPQQTSSQQALTQQAPSQQAIAPKGGERPSGPRIGLDHFNFLAVLGKGNFGKVMLAETKTSKQLYAIKVLKKEFIIENDEVESTRSEKRVFLIANERRHPFLLNLHACFQTETRVYFVMEYISGGDLMLHIQRGGFGQRRAQFYAAEVCLALKYFHEHGVIYRDLKLDNILLTLDGHIKIADYGLCKEDMWYGSTTTTFCGTPEFMAPEILLDKKYGRAVDWWAFGVLIYQMLLQQSPFRGEDEDEIYDAILADEPLYPIHMPRDSVSILQKLLTREPAHRLGSGPTDAQEIMSHSFFRGVNWEDVYEKRVPPPFKPSVKNEKDTSNFDPEFTNVTPVLTPVQSVLSQAMQEEFRGFSYSADFV